MKVERLVGGSGEGAAAEVTPPQKGRIPRAQRLPGHGLQPRPRRQPPSAGPCRRTPSSPRRQRPRARRVPICHLRGSRPRAAACGARWGERGAGILPSARGERGDAGPALAAPPSPHVPWKADPSWQNGCSTEPVAGETEAGAGGGLPQLRGDSPSAKHIEARGLGGLWGCLCLGLPHPRCPPAPLPPRALPGARSRLAPALPGRIWPLSTFFARWRLR